MANLMIIELQILCGNKQMHCNKKYNNVSINNVTRQKITLYGSVQIVTVLHQMD